MVQLLLQGHPVIIVKKGEIINHYFLFYKLHSNKYSVVQDIQSLDYGTLTISDIDYNDIGNYTCIATNSHGYDTSTIELILLGNI